MNPTEKTGNLKEAAAYLVAVALVPVYASMYPVWMQLSGRLDHATLMLLPIVATVSLLGVIILVFRNALTHRRSSRKFVAAGILICCIALLIPDPQLPAKKIHVAEYLLLAGVVRFAMSFRMPPLPLLLFSFLFTALLGVHDEFLQGISLCPDIRSTGYGGQYHGGGRRCFDMARTQPFHTEPAGSSRQRQDQWSDILHLPRLADSEHRLLRLALHVLHRRQRTALLARDLACGWRFFFTGPTPTRFSLR